jgi:hypothetical protein
MNILGATGGNAVTSGVGGDGSNINITAGQAGNAAGTNQSAGTAGTVTIKGGAGGTSTGSPGTSDGGDVVLQSGASGTGGESPTAGALRFKIDTVEKWNIDPATGSGLVPTTTNDVGIGTSTKLVKEVYAHDYKGSAEIWLRPTQAEFPNTNFATIDERNNRPCLDFDTTTEETAQWSFVMPAGYNGGKIKVTLYWACTTATTGTVAWDFDFESVADGESLTDNVFDTESTTGAVTVPGTAGLMSVDAVTVAVADLDGAAAGDLMRMRVMRDTATDNAAGDAELYAVHLKEVA